MSSLVLWRSELTLERGQARAGAAAKGRAQTHTGISSSNHQAIAPLKELGHLLSAEIQGVWAFFWPSVTSPMDSQSTRYVQGWMWPRGGGDVSFSVLLGDFEFIPLGLAMGTLSVLGVPFLSLIQAVGDSPC